MDRRKVIAGNWKMNMDAVSGSDLVSDIMVGLGDLHNTDVIFCPPYPLLAGVGSALAGSPWELGAQNLHWEEGGAYTGEVSASMLLSLGCRYVIIGHSERRQYFGETDATVNLRLKRALRAGLRPIVCVGETLDQRQTDQTEQVIRTQLQVGLEGLSRDDMAACVIAYEPVWAIGTGKTATAEQAVAVHRLIRQAVRQWYDDQLARQLRVQYGGSVNESNAAELLSHEDIDGALVGGASLKAESFIKIVLAGEHNS